MAPRITVRQSLIYSGQGQLKLVCGVRIWQAPNGDLLSTWLSGSDNEPASDNCGVISRSTDGGRTWSEPDVLVEAGDMAGAVGPLLQGTEDRLIAFGNHWPHEKGYTERHHFRMESMDSGHTWGERQPVDRGFGAPIRLQNGEFLSPGGFSDRRDVPLVAPVEQLCEATSEEEARAMPAVEGQPSTFPMASIPSPSTAQAMPTVEGQPSGGKFSTHLHGCCALTSRDDNFMSIEEHGYIANRPLGLLEPVCVQLRDGTIVMLMRAEWGGFLWRAESSDNGRTWTSAWETEIPNPSSHNSLLRLADGRIALIHNAVGKKGTRGPRNPLSIWISDDEMESWSIREDVIATSGNYRPDNWAGGVHGLDWLAYPHGMILNDHLVFVYDRNRRDAVFVEVDIQ